MAMRNGDFSAVTNGIYDPVTGAVNGSGRTAGRTGNALKYLQTGNVQWYAVGLFVGVLALTIVFIRIV